MNATEGTLNPRLTALPCTRHGWKARKKPAWGISRHIREHALRALDSQNPQLLRSAIQALACTGESGDEALLEVLKPRASEAIVAEIEAGIEHLRFRLQSLEALLDEVTDRKSFLRFARALAKIANARKSLKRKTPRIIDTMAH